MWIVGGFLQQLVNITLLGSEQSLALVFGGKLWILHAEIQVQLFAHIPAGFAVFVKTHIGKRKPLQPTCFDLDAALGVVYVKDLLRQHRCYPQLDSFKHSSCHLNPVSLCLLIIEGIWSVHGDSCKC